MGNPKEFIEKLKSYDKDNIKEKLIKKLQKFVDDPKFTPENIAKKSGAAKSMCMWARALYSYSGVMKIIKPKKESLAKAEGELKVA